VSSNFTYALYSSPTEESREYVTFIAEHTHAHTHTAGWSEGCSIPTAPSRLPLFPICLSLQ